MSCIICPSLEECQSWRIRKGGRIKVAFVKIKRRRLPHCWGHIPLCSWNWAWLNSSKLSKARRFNAPRSWNLPPRTTVLCWCQISQARTRNNSSSSVESLSIIRHVNWIMPSWSKPTFYKWGKLLAHTSLAAPQPHSECKHVSVGSIQIGHTTSAITFLRCKLTLVGKISLHALRPNTLLLFGTLNLQIFLHTSWLKTSLDASTQSASLASW